MKKGLEQGKNTPEAKNNPTATSIGLYLAVAGAVAMKRRG